MCSLVVGVVPGSYWLVHIVVPPMGLQTPSAPWVLSLAPSLGTLCSVQWMAVSIHLGICQALSGPLRRQLYQAPVSKHFLASTTVSGFGGCKGESVSNHTIHIYMLCVCVCVYICICMYVCMYVYIYVCVCVCVYKVVVSKGHTNTPITKGKFF